MRIAFAAAGAKILPIEVDEEGIVLERLPPDIRVICVCPSHHFPLGITMSARRRQALIELARNRGAVILEDDYDGEFRYEGSPLEALRTSDSKDVVFYVGTFSKCMVPALRLGFVVAPDWAMPTLVAAKNCLDWHCPTPIQMGVAGFIAEGHLTRHIRKMRELYRERRQVLLTLLEHRLCPWLQPIPSQYGMHITAVTREPADLCDVTALLSRRGIKIHDLSRYYIGAEKHTGLIFGYGTTDPQEITRGITQLRAALLKRPAV